MLEDPPLLTIRRNFPRPSAKQIEAFSGAPTAQVVDAMDGRGALDRAIKPQLRPAAPIVGPALTAFAYPADNLALAACLDVAQPGDVVVAARSEEHTSELQSLMRISYAVFCLKKKKPMSIRLVSSKHYNAQRTY